MADVKIVAPDKPESPWSPEEVRVLACLVEKQMTTPEYYPLTLSALVAACNQKNNRDPVVSYDEDTVSRALDRLRERRVVALVATAGGRAPKYKHLFPETYGLDERDTALLCELMLRGPQTAGELRSRCERYTAMPSIPETVAALEALASRPRPLVARLPRQPGQKEARYMQLFGGPPPAEPVNADTPPATASAAGSELAARVTRLETEVAELKKQLETLLAKRDLL